MLIIGIVLLAEVAVIGNTVTDKTTQVNETVALASGAEGYAAGGINTSTTYTIANNPTGWKVDDCPITNFRIGNSSGLIWTDTTDYVLTAAAGTFTLTNTTETYEIVHGDNKTYVSYSYCSDDYMNLSWGRTGINLVPGFFAIALLLMSVGLFYSIARENGIIN